LSKPDFPPQESLPIAPLQSWPKRP